MIFIDIIVGLKEKGLVLKPLISNRAHDAQRQGCLVNASEIEGTNSQIIKVEVTDCEHSRTKERSILCEILADIIVENLQIRHMVRLLKQDFSFLSEKEQCDILVRVLKRLWYGTSGQKNEVAICKKNVKQRLNTLFLENETETIILEGFMRFRMKDYIENWEKELLACVEDYMQKKEYVEFVEILRLFINIRIPREKKVHLCVDGQGDYMLLDERLCLLKCKLTTDIDKDDALLSALVNMAPLSIIVHNKERFWDARILETIKDIFGKRVEFSEDMI